MTSTVVAQVIYASVFVGVLLAVEGIYLILRSSTRTQKAAERRMREKTKQPTREPRMNLRREQQTGYGPFSSIIVTLFPSIVPFLAQVQEGRISPALAAALVMAETVVVVLVMQLLLDVPPTIVVAVGFSIGFGIPMLIVSGIISSQSRKLAEQLPNAIDLVARGLEAGHPVSVALGLIGQELEEPLGPAFQDAMAEINFGLDRKIALDNVADKYPDANLRFFVAALEMHRETGGDLAGVLRNLSRVIRKRENLRKKAIALSSEGRMTAFLVGGLPFVMISGIYFLQPEYYTSAMDDPSFWPYMTTAFVLWAIGITWIWRMTKIKV